MLKTRLLHRDIFAALGAGGYGAQALIADGIYPLAGRWDFRLAAAGRPTGGPPAGRPLAQGEP